MSDFDQDIDNLFREVIEPNEMSPPKMVWESIDKNLDKFQLIKVQSKYKRLLVFTSGLVVLVAILFGLHLQNYLQSKKTTPVLLVENKPLLQNSTSPLYTNTPSTGKSGITNDSNNLAFKNHNDASVPVYNQQQKTLSKIPVLTKKNLLVNNIGKRNIDSKTEESIAFHDDKIIEKQNGSKKEGIEQKQNATEIIIVAERKTESNNSLDDGNHPFSAFISKKVGEKEVVDSAINIIIAKDNFIDTANIMLVDSSCKGEINIPTITSASQTNKFLIAALFSPDYIEPQLIDSDQKNIKNKESKSFSYTAGIKFSYKFSAKCYLYSGINYSSVSSTIKLEKLFATTNDDGETSYSTETSSGTLHFTLNPTEQAQIQQGGQQDQEGEIDSLPFTVSAIQKRQYISLPLQVQYQISKKQFDFFGFIGLSTNFLLSGQTIFKNEKTGTLYTTKIENTRAFYLSGNIGLGVQYNFIPWAGIFVEPTFHQAITSTNKNNQTSSHPSSFGCTLGFALKF